MYLWLCGANSLPNCMVYSIFFERWEYQRPYTGSTLLQGEGSIRSLIRKCVRYISYTGQHAWKWCKETFWQLLWNIFSEWHKQNLFKITMSCCMRRAVVEPGRPRGCFLGCQSATPGTFIKDLCETNFPQVIHLPTSEVEVLEPLEFKFCDGDY